MTSTLIVDVNEARGGRMDSIGILGVRVPGPFALLLPRDKREIVPMIRRLNANLLPPTSQEGTRTRDWMDPLLSVNLPKWDSCITVALMYQSQSHLGWQ